MQDLAKHIPPDTGTVDLEERRAPRFTLLIRTAKLIVEDRQYLCVVRDISMTGASIKSFHAVPEGKRIALEFPDGGLYPADLIWQNDGEAGFQFHTPIDVEDIIMATGDYPKRDLRFDVEWPLTIEGPNCPIAAHLVNVSRQGGMIYCDSAFAIGQLLRIRAVGMPDIEARVRWRRDHYYGLVLDTTFSLATLAILIRRLHRRNARGQPAGQAAGHTAARPALPQAATAQFANGSAAPPTA
ncbi:PilZ domain-containing protein [Pontixanthobacter sp.]|uniref:PilZ domain-containing protein n=1 Tax=Pontixanthobacter sp. TaxID=2792078 RepID=UPI003C7B2475